MVGLMKPDLKEDLAKWISGDLQAVGLVGIKGKGKEDGRWRSYGIASNRTRAE